MDTQPGMIEREITKRFDQLAEFARTRIKTESEHRFLAGENHFRVKSLRTQLALAALNHGGQVERAAYDDIMDVLISRNAEGYIYHTAHDIGNGYEPSSGDYVAITARNGRPVETALLPIQPGRGEHYRVIASTSDRESVEE